MNRAMILAAGIATSLAVTALWHGPLGAGDRFAAKVEANARALLGRDEMPQIEAHLQRGPLRRRILLSGPADDFQRTEIGRRMLGLPGIGEAAWTASSLPAGQRR